MADYDVVIIGGGISGLSALHFLKSRKPELGVHLYEAETRLGGTIGTDSVDGYSFDWGPNGFLDREPLTLQLCSELGLDNDLEKANENVSKRFILRKNKLRAVPMSPPKFLTSDILSLAGKLRVLMEPFGRGPVDGEDESIYDFVQRRIGTEAADYLVQPMVSGIYGGVASKMSLKSCFPIMAEMESKYGSLFKAMIAKAREAKKKGKKSGGPSGPGGWLTSFHGGLYTIIERMQEQYSPFITAGCRIEAINKNDRDFSLHLSSGQKITSKKIILAVPSHKAAEILSDYNNQLSKAFKGIAYAPIAVVCMGYKESHVIKPLDGFGFLVPQKENMNILGSIWTSSIFKNRAPESSVQFRSMIGGDGNHQSIELSDDQITEHVIDDLDKILGFRGDPEIVKIYRWRHGIPQYHIGHQKRINEIESRLKQHQDIYITGNAYYGIGLNDCVKQSYNIINSLID